MKTETTEQMATREAFAQAVKMSPAALDKWLDSDESKAVGWKGVDGRGDGESVGHKSGKFILAVKRKKVQNLTHADYATCPKSPASFTATLPSARPLMLSTADGATA